MSIGFDGILLDHTREILLLVDPVSLNILEVSKPTLRLLGYRREEIVGRPIADIECSLSDVFFWEEVRQGSLAEVQGTEGAYLCADGQTILASKTISRIDGENGGEAGWLIVRAEPLDIRHRTEDELAYVTSRLRATLEATADGILLIDREGCIVNMNQRFSQMWGLPDDLLVKHDDQKIFDFMASVFNDADAYRQSLAAINADAENETFDTLYLADGRIFERKSRPARHGEQIIGRVFSFADATERMRTQQELIDARDQAKEASRAKGEFLAMMSHEIRTPMNGVIGMAQLLEMTPLNSEQAEYTHTIRSSGEALLGIINDILDYSKIEAKKLQLEIVDFNFPELLHDVEQLFTARIRSGQVTYTSRVEPDLPEMLRGDSVRLRQILLNLIGNAFKFTNEGSITLDVQRIENREDKIGLRFSVKDTGIGIAANKLERIFVPFEQADSSTTRRYGGSGLGLSICSLLTEMMGGKIGVTSQEGVGSEFWFTVYLRHSGDSQVRAPIIVQETIFRRDVRILVAEDNKVNQAVIQNMLNKLGAQNIVIVEDGASVLQACQEQVFDLVFMDAHMPGMDGLDAARALRELGIKTRLIGVSAGALTEDRQTALANGMDDYLVKPITVEELKAAIGRWRDTMRS